MPESDSLSSLNFKNEVILAESESGESTFSASNPSSSLVHLRESHYGIILESLLCPLKREPGSCSGSSAKQALST